MTRRKTIRLLIVDDHPVVRAGLVAMLASYPGLTVLAGMGSGSSALAFLKEHCADVVLLDLRMAEMSGVETLRALKQLATPPKVIILTSFETDDDICQTILGGAEGYLLKTSSDDEMLEAIKVVHFGQRYLPSYIASRFADCAPRGTLSLGDRHFLDLLAQSMSETEIEPILHIDRNEVSARFNRIINQLRKEDVLRHDTTGTKDRVTIDEVARQAGVSISTVSRVLHNKGNHSDETRQAVLRVVKDCGFELNRTAASLALLRARLTAKSK